MNSNTWPKKIDQVNYKAGDTIFNEHDRGDALYILEEGNVRIWVYDEDVKEVTLAQLKPGDFFGELAVLDRGERSSSATAVTDIHLHRLSSDDFQKFLTDHPDAAIDVICEIAQRMRQTNLLVSQRASRNINVEMEAKSTIGQRIADRVASFGGSWTFIIIYLSFLVAWMAFNTFVLVRYGHGEEGAQFDAYPLHSAKPDAFDDRGFAGADHHDVAEPGRGKRSSGGGAGFQGQPQKRADVGRTHPQTARA